jgi:signal transduction histidine kinase
VPNVLERLARALEVDEPRPTHDLLLNSTEHGTCRYHQSFALNELLIEYHILRTVVMEEVATQLARPLEVQEFVALLAGIDEASRRGVQSFVSHQSQQLQAAAEAQSKYLSFMAHDVRGSLNGVVLMMEILKRDLVSEPRFAESVRDLDQMRRSILETVETMDRLLHAERLRKGRVQLRLAPLDLTQLVGELVSQFGYQAAAKNVPITNDLPAGMTIVSDKELITLVLQNLICNAVKYSSRGTVRVTGEKRGGEAVVISVIDQGPGISPEQLQRLFAPFERGETHGQSGMGLGLSIARQSAELLGGKLWADSKAGEGSAFHLELPIEQRGVSPADGSK